MPASMFSAEIKLYRLNVINSQGAEKQLLTCGKNSLEEALCHEYLLGAFTLQYIVYIYPLADISWSKVVPSVSYVNLTPRFSRQLVVILLTLKVC